MIRNGIKSNADTIHLLENIIENSIEQFITTISCNQFDCAINDMTLDDYTGASLTLE